MAITANRRGATKEYFTLWDAVAELSGAAEGNPGFFRRARLRRMIVAQVFDREFVDTLYELTPTNRAQLRTLFASNTKLRQKAQKQLEAATDHHVPQGLALALGFTAGPEPSPAAEPPPIRTSLPEQAPSAVVSPRPALEPGGSGLC